MALKMGRWVYCQKCGKQEVTPGERDNEARRIPCQCDPVPGPPVAPQRLYHDHAYLQLTIPEFNKLAGLEKRLAEARELLEDAPSPVVRVSSIPLPERWYCGECHTVFSDDGRKHKDGCWVVRMEAFLNLLTATEGAKDALDAAGEEQ